MSQLPIEATDMNYPSEPELSDSEKLEFLYQVAVKADNLMRDVGPQLIPMLEGIQKNPMLKMFLGK